MIWRICHLNFRSIGWHLMMTFLPESHFHKGQKMTKNENFQKCTKLTSESISGELVLHICLPAIRSRPKFCPFYHSWPFYLFFDICNFPCDKSNVHSVIVPFILFCRYFWHWICSFLKIWMIKNAFIVGDWSQNCDPKLETLFWTWVRNSYFLSHLSQTFLDRF